MSTNISPTPDSPLTTGHHMFPCSTLPVADAELFGAKMRKPFGRPHYYVADDGRVFKQIGMLSIYATGRICVWPHCGINQRETGRLVGAAEDAFLKKPSKKTGYHFRVAAKSRYWKTYISVPVNERTDAAVAAIRASIDFQDAQDVARITSLAEDAA